jgi:hypothetical protein
MAEITFFVALPFDFVDGGIAAGEPVECASPGAAIERAQGLWRIYAAWLAAGSAQFGTLGVGLGAERPNARVHRCGFSSSHGTASSRPFTFTSTRRPHNARADSGWRTSTLSDFEVLILTSNPDFVGTGPNSVITAGASQSSFFDGAQLLSQFRESRIDARKYR